MNSAPQARNSFRFREKVERHVRRYGEYEFSVHSYRRRGDYALDDVVTEPAALHVESALPSEPPGGVTYQWGPTGYEFFQDLSLTPNGRLRRRVGRPDGDTLAAVPASWGNPRNYYHWMVGELPYLLLAAAAVQRHRAERIAVADPIIDCDTAFACETLARLRAQLEDVPLLSLTRCGQLRPRTLVLPYNNCSYRGPRRIGNAHYAWYHSSRATPYALSALRGLFLDAGISPGGGERIYVQRSTRRLKNEGEVEDLLRAAGFLLVRLEALSVAEQAELFSRAAVVVGMHGAGLTNLSFCAPGTRVVEFADPDDIPPLHDSGDWLPGKRATRTQYHLISRMLGLDYSCLPVDHRVLDMARLEKAIHEQN